MESAPRRGLQAEGEKEASLPQSVRGAAGNPGCHAFSPGLEDPGRQGEVGEMCTLQ